MNEESKSLLSCMVFLGRECKPEGLGTAHYWVQSANKAWHREAPFLHLEQEEAQRHLPSSIRRRFEPLEPAMSRRPEMWALPLGIAEMDEAEVIFGSDPIDLFHSDENDFPA